METPTPNSYVHEHSPDGPDACFGCKIAYMRQNGMNVVTPVMRDGVSWWDTTIKEQQDVLKKEHGPNATPKPVRKELI